jgi:hypothetical protein
MDVLFYFLNDKIVREYDIVIREFKMQVIERIINPVWARRSNTFFKANAPVVSFKIQHTNCSVPGA